MEKCFFTKKLLYEERDGRAPASRYISSHLKPGEMKGDGGGPTVRVKTGWGDVRVH
ncbi:MAG TPA: hypothetical protein VGE85_13285 [Terracidiphilus sp.]